LFQALAASDPDALIRGDAPGKRVNQGGLADAGFSGNENDLTLSSDHLFEPSTHP